MPTTKAGPSASPVAPSGDTVGWERLFLITFGAIIRAQNKTPNPRTVARLAVKLADAGYECIEERRKAKDA